MRQYQVRIHPERLIKYGLTFDEVVEAVVHLGIGGVVDVVGLAFEQRVARAHAVPQRGQERLRRAALGDKVEEAYRFYTVPASNTAVGHIILESKDKPKKAAGKKPASVSRSSGRVHSSNRNDQRGRSGCLQRLQAHSMKK